MEHNKKLSQRQPKDDSRNWGILLLLLALLLFLGALFYKGQDKDKWSIKISHDLKDAAIRRELMQRSTESESENAEVLQNSNTAAAGEEIPTPLTLDQENPGRQVLKDTESRHQQIGRPLTPDQRISAKIEKEQWLDEDQKRRDAEYVQQFLQNARKKGVNLQLNKNLDVTGISVSPTEEPIRIPQSFSNGAK
jgi:hypothetical protein